MSKRILLLRLAEIKFHFFHRLPGQLNKTVFFLSFLGLLLAVYDFGFHRVEAWQNFAGRAYGVFLISFGVLFTLRLVFHVPPKAKSLVYAGETLFIALIAYAIYLFYFLQPYETAEPEIANPERVYYNILLILIFFVEVSRGSLNILKLKFNPPLLFAGSFFFLILLGTGMLMLPTATYSYLSFTDALFTATSAVCVTGLIVVDTSTHFTPFGQGIILVLIQLGGLGVMIFVSFFGFFFQGSFSFQNQIFLKDFVNEENLDKMFKTLGKILFFTFIVEMLGAALIFYNLPTMVDDLDQMIWFSVFHSVSAFCNAGFSIATDGLHNATMGLRYAYNLHLVIALLIIAGGVGFPVVLNIYRFFGFWMKNLINIGFKGGSLHFKPKVINVNTRLAITTTVILLMLGTALFWVFERDGVLTGLDSSAQFVTAFFGAVTPRTAGFNTVDLNNLAMPTLLLTIFLMWVGASPASTGGGIKTSTLALALLNIKSIAKGINRVEYFGREISSESLQRAFGIIIMSVLVIGLCVFGLSATNPEISIRAIVFESVSAFSTVGLSLGITHQLNDTGKLILTAAMFIGRIGTLTLLVAFFKKLSSWSYRYPTEQVFIN